MKRRNFNTTVALLSCAPLVGCSGETSQYAQTNLVADTASAHIFKPAVSDIAQVDKFINAWGIAIRPAGAGGHFWVTAGKYSYQFLGDVTTSPDAGLKVLRQDALKLVQLPGTEEEGTATGTVFNGAPIDSNKFWIANQAAQVNGKTVALSGSARFIFATDSGVISGWTERDPTNLANPVRVDGAAVSVVDDRTNGSAFFGIAIRPDNWSTLWAADFGVKPRLRQFNDQWIETDLQGFKNPFASGANGTAVPGDYVPFNVQVLSVGAVPRVFVAYAKSQADPKNSAQFLAAEEDALDAKHEGSRPKRGKVVMYSLEGAKLKVFDDGRLNAPWGLAIAPAKFGDFSNHLLVGNFGGSGRIAAFDLESGEFKDWLRNKSDKPVAIAGLWGLQFGNGASLGDSSALYFAAGPADETQGVFGALRQITSSK